MADLERLLAGGTRPWEPAAAALLLSIPADTAKGLWDRMHGRAGKPDG